MKTEILVVDNNTFVLGLDELYREAMKSYERDELLKHAKNVANELNIEPIDCPIEGYYYEEPELTEYFKIMRSLQDLNRSECHSVLNTQSYLRLYEIVSSPIFGKPFDDLKLLPSATNQFNNALTELFPNWSIPEITEKAYDKVSNSDDFSLVALGVLTKDPVVVTALRESVALYMAVVAAGIPEPVQYKYEWRVDSEIQKRAIKFVNEFNSLFNNELPMPREENAKLFFDACNTESLFGRCIYIGKNSDLSNMKFYHWALKFDNNYNIIATDFWDDKIVTTEKYRESLLD